MPGIQMRRNDLILTVAGALMLALSRLPIHLGWLVFFAWVPYIHMFRKGIAKPKQIWLMAAITAVIYDLIVFYWFALVTVPGLIGVVLFYTAVYFVIFYSINRIYRVMPKWGFLGFIALILTFEYIQNFAETRFPWFSLAYSLADYNTLIQFADLGGIVGISFLILIANLLFYQLLPLSQQCVVCSVIQGEKPSYRITGKRMACFVALLSLFAGWIGYGRYALQHIQLEKHDAKIYVMQPSINQEVKWAQEQYGKSMAIFRKLTLEAAADSARLVIWPEGAVTNYLMRVPITQRDVRAILDTAKVEIFTGFPDVLPAERDRPDGMYYYNAASLFKPGQFFNELYYKNYLVPVAERMLFLDVFPFMWKLEFGQANWEFGKELKYFESGGYRFSPSICYELAFPSIFHRMAIPLDPQTRAYHKSDYLVNITNDAWFGTSYGPWLHAVMARFRAVENRIQIYRSANTGISLVVDPKGRVLAQTKLFEVKNITAPLYTTPRIPLIRRIQGYPWIFVALAVVLSILSMFIKKRD
jgi:apolipoprotein N-acyltransferase